MEFLRVITGADMQHIPYQGTNPAVTAVIADQIPVRPLVRQGRQSR
jgi:tripartite-type tricarboxylate transporter receptor subunit TctC